MAAGHHDRNDVTGFRDDGKHPDVVAQAAHDGRPDPPEQHRAGGGGPQRPPEHRGRLRRNEVAARPGLVRQCQSHAQVGVQVDQVPGPVPHRAAGGPDRRRDNGDEGQGAGRCQQHARVLGQQNPDLVQQTCSGGSSVARHDGDDVHEHQIEGQEADHPVLPGEHVLAPDPLQPRDSGHHQDLQQQKVGGQQTGQRQHDPRSEPASPGAAGVTEEGRDGRRRGTATYRQFGQRHDAEPTRHQRVLRTVRDTIRR